MVLPSRYNGYRPIFKRLTAKYKDPLAKGIIKITNSSVSRAAGHNKYVNNLINWNGDGWISANVKNPYFIVDFKNFFVSIPSYGLRSFLNDHTLINWTVYGSRSGENDDWTLIDQRSENICEGYINQTSKYCTKITENFYNTTSKDVYRYIKVQQKGYNSKILYSDTSNPWTLAFYLGAFEIFGDIYIPDSNCKVSICIKPRLGPIYSVLFMQIMR